MSNPAITEPIEVLTARALSPNNGGWVLRRDLTYDDLEWNEAQAGGPKPTEAEWNAKLAELQE